MAAAAALLSGCALTNDVHFTPFDNGGAETFAPVSPKDVKIYASKLPDKPYEELGIMTLKSLYVPDDRSSIYSRFRDKAASVGANGILLMPDNAISDAIPRVTRYGTYYDNANDTYVFSAAAIRVKE